MSITLDLSGDKALVKNLNRLNFRVARSLRSNATRSGAALFRKYARTYVPKQSGDLRKAMVYRRTFRNRFSIVYSIGFGKRSYYGKPLELGGTYRVKGGTRFQPAKPMLRRALASNSNEVVNKVRDMLWRGIRREAIKNAR